MKKPELKPKCIGKCSLSVVVRDYNGPNGIEEYYKCGSCNRTVPKRQKK